MFKRFVNVVEVLVAVAALVFVVLLFANEPGSGGSASDDSGAAIYSSSCARCHGTEGDGAIGPALADGAVVDAFPDVDDEIAVVTDGRGGMPSFGGDLTPDEIRRVVEYTRTDLGN